MNLVHAHYNAKSQDTTDEQIRNGLAGMIMAAGAPKGYRALREAWDHYQRTGKVMLKMFGGA